MRNFRKFDIWKQGVDLAVIVYRISKKLPREETYGLQSQIRRASVSIPSNIAEGCSRSSEKEFKRFLEISLGSSFEVETNLILAERLALISGEDLANLLESLHTVQRQINSLITKLRQPKTNS